MVLLNTFRQKSKKETNSVSDTVKVLTCGKAVNYTQYDHLRGIINRQDHVHVPEPDVALMFKKKGSRSSEVDMNELEDKLRKSKKEVCFTVILHIVISRYIEMKSLL